jgi:hypothetical protein
MATCTHAIGTADTGNTPNTSGAFTPALNDLLVVFVVVSGSVGSSSASLSCSTGMTFTPIQAENSWVLFASSANGVMCFVSDSLVSSAVSQTVTTSPSDAGTGSIIFVCRVSGMTKTGATAIRQVAIQENQAASGTPAPVFSAAALTNNPTLGFIGNNSSPAGMTPPTGWTEPATTGDLGYGSPTTGGAYCFRDSGFTGTTITWGSTSASVFASIIIELDASGAGTTLTAGSGSFSMTGNAASALWNRTLTAETGSFAYTGNAASALKGTTVTAEAGSFAYTGNDANIKRDYSLQADAGGFAYTGNDANALRGLRLIPEAGAFGYTGNDATATVGGGGYTLVPDAGSFAYTGNDANALRGLLLAAEAGAFAYVGNDAQALRGLRLIADAGTFSYTGNDATAFITPAGSHTLSAGAGSFAYTGNDANVIRAYRLTADAGTFTVNGNDAIAFVTPSGSHTLIADAGSFAYTGNDAAIVRAYGLLPDSGVFVYTGNAASLNYSGSIFTAAPPLIIELESGERYIILEPGERSIILGD